MNKLLKSERLAYKTEKVHTVQSFGHDTAFPMYLPRVFIMENAIYVVLWEGMLGYYHIAVVIINRFYVVQRT